MRALLLLLVLANSFAITADEIDKAITTILATSEEMMTRLSQKGDGHYSKLAITFNNSYTFTATRTWSLFADGTVFVHTGDIKQMWLRDSSQQIRPYLPLTKTSPHVSAVFSAIFQRMARFFVGDPYASAFNERAQPTYDVCPPTLDCLNCTCVDCAPACSNHTYKHNYEMDSYCFVVDLVHRHWKLTGDRSALDSVFHTSLKKWVRLLEVEQDHTNLSPYRFANHTPTHGAAKVGLLWGFSRPSDDDMQENYNIPDNMLAVVALGKAAMLARDVFGDRALAVKATALMESVDAAIQEYGIFAGNATLAPIYAFEVDGFGHQVLADDANLPNLLSIPYLGYPDKAGLYANTRDFSLRPPRRFLVPIATPVPANTTAAIAATHANANATIAAKASSTRWQWWPGNPNYFDGSAASGLGSSHMSHGLRPVNPGPQCMGACIWPLGLIMEGLTATAMTGRSIYNSNSTHSHSHSNSHSDGNSDSNSYSSRTGQLEAKGRDEDSQPHGETGLLARHGSRRSPQEILAILLRTDANQSYMHEGFDSNDPLKYNRDLFGWANSMFAAWVATIYSKA